MANSTKIVKKNEDKQSTDKLLAYLTSVQERLGEVMSILSNHAEELKIQHNIVDKIRNRMGI